MRIEYKDFNGSKTVIGNKRSRQWTELARVLREMPLHLKASDQKNTTGKPIFDPKGTNKYINTSLVDGLHWQKIKIPVAHDAFGKDLDFGKAGMAVEVQFSNYPFLVNNVMRLEIFSKCGVQLGGHAVEVLVIVTKAGMFRASNSTLYYEQADRQLAALSENRLFTIPVRLVGLFPDRSPEISAVWTDYSNTRHSRTISTSASHVFAVSAGRTKWKFEIKPPI